VAEEAVVRRVSAGLGRRRDDDGCAFAARLIFHAAAVAEPLVAAQLEGVRVAH